MRADGVIDHREADTLRGITPGGVGEPSTGLEHTARFRRGLVRVGNVRQAERIQHRGKLSILERQRFGIPLRRSGCRDRSARRGAPARRKHRCRRRRPPRSRAAAATYPAPQSDIENLVAALEACGVEKIGNASDGHLPHIHDTRALWSCRTSRACSNSRNVVIAPSPERRFHHAGCTGPMEYAGAKLAHCRQPLNDGDTPWQPASATSRCA